MKKAKKKKGKKSGFRFGILTVSAFSILVSIAATLFSMYQISCYEKSVIDIYATQQDAFVQLVLDQINLVEDRSSTEIVNDILGTLDSSSNRYWTLSEEHSLIFVKDVSETNRYKGFTTETYFVSEDARVFLGNLYLNKVTHKLILIGSTEYIASGVSFNYNGRTYQICLMTNPNTVLDHNIYMNAKINLIISVATVLGIFLVMTLILTLIIEQKQRHMLKEQRINTELRCTIEKMNAVSQRERLFDTRSSVFDIRVYEMLQEKLKARRIAPVTTAWLSYKNDKARDSFLKESQVLLDQSILRLHDKENKKLVLVGVQCKEEQMMEGLRPFLQKGITIDSIAENVTQPDRIGWEDGK